jgi:Abnormal spindle-like microcephaly-assoc'd, ASPM-SPD-2-Hydin
LQQVSCAGGGTTSISGTVYAPNGTDPLPNVLVYIPNAPVAAFAPGVSCPAAGTPPSGSPLVGTTTAVDGTFTLTDVPVGTSLPLLIQSGRWRRQVVVPITTACANTAFSTRMPQNQSEGDIPKIAVATGAADAVECVLRKVGIADSEFTDPGGTGRVNLFSGSHDAGAQIDTATPSENALMGDFATLSAYDLLMLPCEGAQYTQPDAQLGNLIQFANAGGRVYSSHFSYVWMYQNGPFAGTADWAVEQAAPASGIATVNAGFSGGQALSQWLQLVGASTVPGQIAVSQTKHDLDGVIAPTQSWLTLNDSADGNPVMQFVFDAPVGAATNQCGRVLFNEYHVEGPTTTPTGVIFPNECSTAAMTPQEKLLEYSLFELTTDGGPPTLTPAAADFGSQPVGITSAAQSFTWINNSTFAAGVSSMTASGDFRVSANNCGSVSGGGSCLIPVVFTPAAVGARTGTLTVVSGETTLTAALTGTGTPDLTLSATTLNFGSLDVGASAKQVVTLTNNTTDSLPLAAIAGSGDFAVSSSCGATMAALASCAINVTFTPTVPGARSGTLTIGAGASIALSGDGTDFTIASSPESGSVGSGYGASLHAITSPLGGFDASVTLRCTTTAPAATCTLATASFVPTQVVTTTVTIATTPPYGVVDPGGLLWLFGVGGGWLVWRRRRGLGQLALLMVVLAVLAMGMTGCTGKEPSANTPYTVPGSYTVTLTATDGFLVHSATYALTVTQ